MLLRSAVDSDAEALVALWGDALRRGDHAQQLDDVRNVVDRVSAMPEEQIVVGVLDDRVVGAVYLRATTWSPVNLERVVLAISPHVLPEFRRHGVGSALMESAVAFAEELGIGHVGTAVESGSRESNRFMARLALGPAATLRVAATATVKARLHANDPAARARGRHLTQVLAARRSMRRTPSAT
ncbi:GNAT family N-acetyltransferase [Nocardioides coralli]|nr:GNAT family N-acetyltransferase [Nocardioides coralli]